jgi:puromycin-sensitive aminopeptidase
MGGSRCCPCDLRFNRIKELAMTFRKICCSLSLVSVLVSTNFGVLRAEAGTPDAVSTVVSTSKAKTETSEASLRLPKTTTPAHYNLIFEPDLKSFTFLGTEQIALDVAAETSVITLNAAELTITDAALTSGHATAASMTELPGGGTENKTLIEGTVQHATVEMDAEKELVHLQFKAPLAPGKYVLSCKFKGRLNDELRGFYRSAYVDQKGVTHFLATTQMEPTDARRMFPSFDEPSFKASYQITAIIDAAYTAISNAPVATDEKNAAGKRVVKFESTPKMSSYLVALIVGELKPTATKTANGVPITVWTTPGKEHLGEYALNTATEILPAEEGYFGIPYPGKKLDLIALPDFDAGAMENLGAITFREALLLVDNKTGTNFLKRTIASITAHEMAHQWVGDLVTMRWWDDLWLNEAFATWMATKTVNKIRPEWRFLAKSVETRNFAMSEDQLASTRAIHAHVSNPSQAVEMFDGITYEKGASILRMLECFVSEKTFQKGIHDYLTSHAYNNATTEELWEAIAAASGGSVPVPEIMKPWVYQPGFPLVTLSAQEPGKSITLEQSRFFEASDAKASNSLWRIPMVFHPLGAPVASNVPTGGASSESAAVNNKLLSGQQDSYTIADAKSVAFANKDGSGFFRVRYAQPDFDAIAAKFSSLAPEERMVLLSDTGALSVSGKIPVENRLNLLLKIRDEKDLLVLSEIVGAFDSPYTSMTPDTMPAYQAFVSNNLRLLKKDLGWDAKPGEKDLAKDLRAAVLNMLGTYGQDKETISEAFTYYHKYMADHSSLNPDVVPSILQIVAYNGTLKDYEEIEKGWRTAKAPEDEKRMLRTLAVFRNPELVAKTLDLIVSGQIRGQDSPGVLSSLLSHYDTQEQSWQFVKQNWNKILKLFPPTSMRHVASACSTFYRPKDEKDLVAFFGSHKVPFGDSAVSRALEDVHISVLYHEQSDAAIQKWVKAEASK